MKDFNINMSEFDLLDPNNYTEEKKSDFINFVSHLHQ